MKTIIFIIIAMLATQSLAQTKVTLYGDDAYPPYSYAENGKMKGIYTSVLRKIFAQMPDYSVTLKGLPWKRGLAKVKQGDILALYPPYKRPKDRPYMSYDAPILDEKLVVFCRDQVMAHPRPKWPEDYYGLTIGNNLGFSIHGDKLLKAIKEGKIKIQETKSTSKNLEKLISGRIDCYMNDGLSIRWELKTLQKKHKYDGTGLQEAATISAEQGFLGFTTVGNKFPYKEAFKKQYLSILSKMKASGEVKKIINDYVK
jgi:polar amino acid transport system substrate-binding protein